MYTLRITEVWYSKQVQKSCSLYRLESQEFKKLTANNYIKFCSLASSTPSQKVRV